MPTKIKKAVVGLDVYSDLDSNPNSSPSKMNRDYADAKAEFTDRLSAAKTRIDTDVSNVVVAFDCPNCGHTLNVSTKQRIGLPVDGGVVATAPDYPAFAIGDRVRPRSGGPIMRVVDVLGQNSKGQQMVLVRWTDGDEDRDTACAASLLEHVTHKNVAD